MEPPKHFTRTVAIFLGAWAFYWFVIRFGIAWATMTFVPYGPFLSSPLFQFVDGLNIGIELAAVLQIAIWWSWYRPARRSARQWWILLGLLWLPLAMRMIQFVVPGYYDLVSTVGDPPRMPWPLMLIYSSGLVMSVFSSMIAIYFLSPIIRVEMLSVDEIAGATIRRGQWTIVSLMLATGLVAVTLTMTRATLRLQDEYYGDVSVAETNTTILLGIIYQAITAFANAGLMCWIAWMPVARLYQIGRWLPVVGVTIIFAATEWAYIRMSYPKLFSTSNSWQLLTTILVRDFFCILTVDVITRWFIRRWRTAGFVPVTSREARPAQSLPENQT